MMTVHFMPMEVTAYLYCRRGRSTFRKVRIDIGIKEAVYNALPQSALEVVDATGHIWSRCDVRENRGKVILDYLGPPKAAFDPQVYAKQEKAEAKIKSFNEKYAELEKKQEEEYRANQEQQKAAAPQEAALADKLRGEAANKIIVDEFPEEPVANMPLALESASFDGNPADERTTAPKFSKWPKEKDDDDVQQVGGERSPDGETIRRPVHVQVPLVGSVDARLERAEERGAEGGSDGLHSSDDEPNVLDNRHAPRVRLISPADEDSGRD